MEELLGLTNPAPLSLTTLAVNMVLTGLLGSAIAWFYTHYGRSLSNRAKFAQTLPVLALITVLIISVVKSSLALSLGLVGALSIIRFRTAIKEPEELVYLFFALSVGLGFGADQRWPTLLAFLVILSFLLLRTFLTPRPLPGNLYFNVSTPDEEGAFAQINSLLTTHLAAAELRRLDRSATLLQATYLVAVPDEETMAELLQNFRATLPEGEISFVEQDNTLSA